jgi:hypothetical protein
MQKREIFARFNVPRNAFGGKTLTEEGFVLCSVDYCPLNWCVVTSGGINSVFFATYKEAIAFCQKRGFKFEHLMR